MSAYITVPAKQSIHKFNDDIFTRGFRVRQP